ncbi:MAG: hypothetical protein V2A76_10615 [Planctomycetota bacterium]
MTIERQKSQAIDAIFEFEMLPQKVRVSQVIGEFVAYHFLELEDERDHL